MAPDEPAPGSTPPESTRSAHTRRARPALRGELLAFLAVSFFALIAVAGATILLSGWIARDNQLGDAERMATRIADHIVEPLLDDPRGGLAVNRSALDTLLLSRVQDRSVSAFLVWDAEGRIVYSSDRDDEGDQPGISDELAAALRGEVVSDVDEDPEIDVP